MQLQAWPSARVERLAALWGSTLPTAEIAQTLNAEFPAPLAKPVTLHAVAHKAKAAGLPERPRAGRPLRPISNGGGGFAALMGGNPQEPTFFADDCEDEPLDRPTIGELGRNQCRWPVYSKGPFRFCGDPTGKGVPYCSAHHRRSIRWQIQMTPAEIDGLRV